jgi:hypothetical protein
MGTVPPVLTILMAATGAQVGDAERDGVSCRDLLIDGELGSREPLADAEREHDVAPTRLGDRVAEAERERDDDGEGDKKALP